MAAPKTSNLVDRHPNLTLMTFANVDLPLKPSRRIRLHRNDPSEVKGLRDIFRSPDVITAALDTILVHAERDANVPVDEQTILDIASECPVDPFAFSDVIHTWEFRNSSSSKRRAPEVPEHLSRDQQGKRIEPLVLPPGVVRESGFIAGKFESSSSTIR